MKLSMDVQHYHEYEYANADIIMSMIYFSSQLSCVFMMNRAYSSYALVTKHEGRADCVSEGAELLITIH